MSKAPKHPVIVAGEFIGKTEKMEVLISSDYYLIAEHMIILSLKYVSFFPIMTSMNKEDKDF